MAQLSSCDRVHKAKYIIDTTKAKNIYNPVLYKKIFANFCTIGPQDWVPNAQRLQHD